MTEETKQELETTLDGPKQTAAKQDAPSATPKLDKGVSPESEPPHVPTPEEQGARLMESVVAQSEAFARLQNKPNCPHCGKPIVVLISWFDFPQMGHRMIIVFCGLCKKHVDPNEFIFLPMEAPQIARPTRVMPPSIIRPQ